MARTSTRDLAIKVSVQDQAGKHLDSLAKKIEGLSKGEKLAEKAAQTRAKAVEGAASAETRARERAAKAAERMMAQQARTAERAMQAETRARERAAKAAERAISQQTRATERLSAAERKRRDGIEQAVWRMEREAAMRRQDESIARHNAGLDARGPADGGLGAFVRGAAPAAALAGIAAIGAALKEGAESAIEHERAMLSLSAALDLHGYSASISAKSLDDRNAAIERSLGLDADALAGMQAQLLLLGVLPDQLDKATDAAIGWAATTGKSLDSAGQDVARVLEGQVPGTLKKFAGDLKTTEERLEFMSRGLSTAAAQAESTGGNIQRLGKALGEIAENAVTPAVDSMRGLAGSLVSAAQATADFIDRWNKLGKMSPIRRQGQVDIPIGSGGGGPVDMRSADEIKRARFVGPVGLSPDESIIRNAEQQFIEAEKIRQEKIRDARERAIEESIKVQRDAVAAQSEAWKKYQTELSQALAAADRGIAVPLPRRPDIIGPMGSDGPSSFVRTGPSDEIRARKAEMAQQNAERSAEIQDKARDKAEAVRAPFDAMLSGFAADASNTLADSFMSGFDGIEDAFFSMLESMAQQLIASSILSLVGSLIGGPFGGKIANQGLGLFFSRGGPVRKMASGGMVRGGTGIDGIPAMLDDGEYVVPASLVRAIRAQAQPSTPVQLGPAMSSGSSSTSVNITYSPRALTPQSHADIARDIRRGILPALGRLQR